MPTPFTHLETAQRLLVDKQIPSEIRAALAAEKPAFLLGSIAADARVGAAMKREDTHFYDYDHGITEHPWRVMMNQYPALDTPSTPAQRVFLAAYVAHLTMDEIWTLQMLGPYFVQREWASRPQRFLMLHMLLIYMDDRDYRRLQAWQGETLKSACPENWLPFVSDKALDDWRDFIASQLPPGRSETLDVLGARINRTPDELQTILDSPEQMERDLWANIPHEALASVEAVMYDHARKELAIYWQESAAKV